MKHTASKMSAWSASNKLETAARRVVASQARMVRHKDRLEARHTKMLCWHLRRVVDRARKLTGADEAAAIDLVRHALANLKPGTCPEKP